jgi:hypothetical protein
MDHSTPRHLTPRHLTPRTFLARTLGVALAALAAGAAFAAVPETAMPGQTWSVAMNLSVSHSKGFPPEQLARLRSMLAEKSSPEKFCSGADFLSSMAQDLSENCSNVQFARKNDGSALLSGLCSGQRLTIDVSPSAAGYAGTARIETADKALGASATIDGSYQAANLDAACARPAPKTR